MDRRESIHALWKRKYNPVAFYNRRYILFVTFVTGASGFVAKTSCFHCNFDVSVHFPSQIYTVQSFVVFESCSFLRCILRVFHSLCFRLRLRSSSFFDYSPAPPAFPSCSVLGAGCLMLGAGVLGAGCLAGPSGWYINVLRFVSVDPFCWDDTLMCSDLYPSFSSVGPGAGGEGYKNKCIFVSIAASWRRRLEILPVSP